MPEYKDLDIGKLLEKELRGLMGKEQVSQAELAQRVGLNHAQSITHKFRAAKPDLNFYYAAVRALGYRGFTIADDKIAIL